jgi:hypothetical protein
MGGFNQPAALSEMDELPRLGAFGKVRSTDVIGRR